MSAAGSGGVQFTAISAVRLADPVQTNVLLDLQAASGIDYLELTLAPSKSELPA